MSSRLSTDVPGRRLDVFIFILIWILGCVVAFFAGRAWEKWHAAAGEKQILTVDDSTPP